MSAVISPEIKKQFFDSNGDPLSGGKLYVYEAGTTTPVTTYTSAEADTPNSNPIILDVRGEIGAMYLMPDSYKFVLNDSDDNSIWTIDNVSVRDLASEIDAITTSLAVTEVSTTNPNRIISGKKSLNSNSPRFLVPISTTNQLKLLATTTPLIYSVNGTEYSVTSDTVASGLVTAPTANNTALINNNLYADSEYTKSLGHNDTSISIDSIGSEISNKNGRLAGFKIEGVSTEYFMARIDSTNSKLVSAKRGCFFDIDGNPIPATAFSDNDTITLMNLTFVYIHKDGTMIVSYTEPIYSTTEPNAPLDGDMWYDIENKVWKRFNSTAFVQAESTFLGICLQDENGNTVAAMGEQFYAEVSDENTIQIEYLDAYRVRTTTNNNRISVADKNLLFDNSFKIWDITAHLEDDEVETASTAYHLYINIGGDPIVSPYGPIEYFGKMRGKYHPYELYRYVGSISNDSSSNFDSNSIVKFEDFTKNKTLLGLVPSGVMLPFAGSSAPEGYFHADGRELSRTAYPDLFTAIGTNYGEGDGSTTFNIPDTRWTFLRGYGLDIEAIGSGVAGGNSATFENHGFNRTGIKVRLKSGTLSGLSTSTDYWIIVIDEDTLAFAANRADSLSDVRVALSGTNSAVINQYEDPDASSRLEITNGSNMAGNVGSHQEDNFKSHNHDLITYRVTPTGSGTNPSGLYNSQNGNSYTTESRGGNETRPSNIYALYIIKI